MKLANRRALRIIGAPSAYWFRCGRSSGVERNLAKVEVVGSNPIARSSFSYNINKIRNTPDLDVRDARCRGSRGEAVGAKSKPIWPIFKPILDV